MRRITCRLEGGRPVTRVLLVHRRSGATVRRVLLSDTGAGRAASPFALVLSLEDCGRFARPLGASVELGGAMVGSFMLCSVIVAVPDLAFRQDARVVAVPSVLLPSGLDGIAGFRFLSQFTYGNFGDPGCFGLEALPA